MEYRASLGGHIDTPLQCFASILTVFLSFFEIVLKKMLNLFCL